MTFKLLEGELQLHRQCCAIELWMFGARPYFNFWMPNPLNYRKMILQNKWFASSSKPHWDMMTRGWLLCPWPAWSYPQISSFYTPLFLYSFTLVMLSCFRMGRFKWKIEDGQVGMNQRWTMASQNVTYPCQKAHLTNQDWQQQAHWQHQWRFMQTGCVLPRH